MLWYILIGYLIMGMLMARSATIVDEKGSDRFWILLFWWIPLVYGFWMVWTKKGTLTLSYRGKVYKRFGKK